MKLEIGIWTAFNEVLLSFSKVSIPCRVIKTRDYNYQASWWSSRYAPITLHKMLPSKFLQRHGETGFTLIELLIVIFIIGVIASFATLSISFSQNKRFENLANQLNNTFLLAQQEALLRSVTLGFKLTSTSYQFYEFNPQGNLKNPWQPFNDSILGTHSIPKDVKITLKMKSEAPKNDSPQLFISPGDNISPFNLYIGKRNAPPAYKIAADTSGVLKVHAL